MFDFLCDLNFAFAAQKRHRSHFAKIHAYGIARLTDQVAIDVRFEFFFVLLFFSKIYPRPSQGHPLIGIHDFDVHLAKDRHDIINLIRRHHFGRKHVVDVVVRQIALLLTEVNELFDLLLHVLLFARRGALGGQLLGFYGVMVFTSSFRRSSWRSSRTTSCHSSILSRFAFSSFFSSAARIAIRRFLSTPFKYFRRRCARQSAAIPTLSVSVIRSEEHTSELQSRF